MTKWQLPSRTVGLGGWFQIVITKPGHFGVDVTFLRNVPTQLENFSSADPFGDSTAVITFPQLTGFDDHDASDLVNWFGLFSNVDIYWVKGIDEATYSTYSPTPREWIDPITNTASIYAPGPFTGDGHPHDFRWKLWEGYVSSIEINAEDNSNSVQMQCQGALFQLDRYLQKPFYPPRPIPLEKLIQDTFDPKHKPHLRTKPLKIDWPDGWDKTVPARNKGTNPAYVLDAKAGSRWTGYASRQTGSWERCLTGFIQDQLAVMIVQSGTNGPVGSNWTVLHQHGITGTDAARTPVLTVRDNNRDADFAVWIGTPGITCSFTHDGTQMANIVYGDGTSVDGTTWRNAIISNDGSRTDYQPLAWIDDVYPYTHNKQFSRSPFVSEAYLKFGAGFEQSQATDSAEKQLQRDLDSGWSGTMTMKIDPSTTLSRWLIRAGMSVRVYGLAGTGTDGIKFHIPEINANPNDGSITLTLDTRYRDLLTVEEARARTRDPLTPTRMLQINRTSVLIEDLSAPWDYHAGSGFIPRESTKWWKTRPYNDRFPYVATLKAHPPKRYPHYYVKVNANAGGYGSSKFQTPTNRTKRWTRVPILTAEKGTIRRIEAICVDVNGNILKVPFHLSLYYVRATPQAMPRDANGPSPYINNAFTSVDPATGNPWPPGNFLAPEPSYIIGWGGKVNGAFDRAGFFPGSETLGSPVSGLFVDENTFSFDNTSGTNLNWNPNATVGEKQSASAITIYAMFYAEYKQPVYFLARMWRQDPGVS